MSGPFVRLPRVLLPSRRSFVERPLADGRALRLEYLRTRTARRSAPILVIPGGPGMSSDLPYSLLRRLAARREMDLLMVEHRGVGASRRDEDGAELRTTDVTLAAAADDLDAVLDAEGVERAVVYGASYGSALAQLFAARHPGRIAALVLDSPLLDPIDDLRAARERLRALLWSGAAAGYEAAADGVRRLGERLADAELANLARFVHEYAGPDVLSRLAPAWASGRFPLLRRILEGAGSGEFSGRRTPRIMEPDLVRGIAFGELGFGLPRDGGPLDPQAFVAAHQGEAPSYARGPVDLREAARRLRVPTVVVSGEFDLRTPGPVAARLASLAPGGVLVEVPRIGHSILDAHPLLALAIAQAVADGREALLPRMIGRLRRLPRIGAPALAGALLRGVARLAGEASASPTGS
ncbi:alpha/beta fold hydrolase [Actinomyces culturomici]|uniref:alpha/beta fold hydrolase n=1 Tax=Actinomyces culturomici TaxID=1926276 RepID=UPI000E2032BB|nr:alpha/beta fold hydrolase [Actinomyces culturomici]